MLQNARVATRLPLGSGVVWLPVWSLSRSGRVVDSCLGVAFAGVVVEAGTLTSVHDTVDGHRRRLGEFTGRGAALHARISGLTEGLADLEKSAKATDGDVKFANDSQATLEQLAASVRASERMPTPRRKATARAVAGELDQLEGQLLHRLGV